MNVETQTGVEYILARVKKDNFVAKLVRSIREYADRGESALESDAREKLDAILLKRLADDRPIYSPVDMTIASRAVR